MNLKRVTILLLIMGVVLFWTMNNANENDIDADELQNKTIHQPKQGKGDIIIIEFSDFKCPYCGLFERNIKPKLAQSFIKNNKVEFRYVNVLLHGKESERGARAAHAVNLVAPNQYWQFHELLFQSQPKSKNDVGQTTWLTDDLIRKLTNQLDLSNNQKERILKLYQDDKGEAAKQTKADHQLAKAYGVPQVPMLYINGKAVKHMTNYQDVEIAIKEALN